MTASRLISILSLALILCSCNSQSKDEELEKLLANLDFEESASILSSTELARRPLAANRTNITSIATGQEGKRIVQSLVTSGAFDKAARRNEFWCSGGACICSGDADCNDMFSTVCRSPSTGGACYGDVPVCVCTP